MKETLLVRGALLSCAVRTYLSSRMKNMVSRLRFLPQMNELFAFEARQQSAAAVAVSHFSNLQKNHNRQPARGHWPPNTRQTSNGGEWGDGRRRDKFPVKLMDFPERSVPSFVKSFRNRFFSFLIRAYYDATFTIDGFLEGATQAASIVSQCISDGNFADLKGLVVEEAVTEIQNNYADLSLQQRRWLRIKPSDLIGKFVFEIGMMFDDHTDQRFVEITVVLHGYHDMEERPSSLSELYSHMGENPEKFYVANYRFIREFTKGVDTAWTINKLNHFTPFVPPEDEDGSSSR